MSVQLLAEGLPPRVLLGGGRPWIERRQRQGMIEMVGGDQQQTDSAAQHSCGQLSGCECLVVAAKKKVDDLSQRVKAHAGDARGSGRVAEVRVLAARRRVGRSFQTRNEVLLELERVAITATLGDDSRVLPGCLQDIVQPVALLEGQLYRIDPRIAGVQDITCLHQSGKSLMQRGQAGRDVIAPRVDKEAMTKIHNRLQTWVLEFCGQTERHVRKLESRLKIPHSHPRSCIPLVQDTGFGGMTMAQADVYPSSGKPGEIRMLHRPP